MLLEGERNARSNQRSNIKFGLDTTELEASIKSLNNDPKEQQRDLVAINKNLKYDPSNLDLWKQKREKLNASLETTKKKLEEQKGNVKADYGSELLVNLSKELTKEFAKGFSKSNLFSMRRFI